MAIPAGLNNPFKINSLHRLICPNRSIESLSVFRLSANRSGESPKEKAAATGIANGFGKFFTTPYSAAAASAQEVAA